MTTYDELTPDALFLLENMAEIDIVQTCAERGARITELTAELAALRSGEEPYDDERLMPTPGQWIWRWNRAAPEERLAVAEGIGALRDQRDRVEAVARDWYDAQPLIPGQALADLRNALSGDPQPVYMQAAPVRDHLIRVTGTRVPTPAELRAVAALLDANEDALARDKPAANNWVTWLTAMIGSTVTRDAPPALRGPNYPKPEPDPTPLRKLAAQALAEGGPLPGVPPYSEVNVDSDRVPEELAGPGGLYKAVMDTFGGPLPWPPPPLPLCACGAQRLAGKVVHVEGCFVPWLVGQDPPPTIAEVAAHPGEPTP